MKTENSIRKESVERIAAEILVAARTAPKGKGRDNIEMGILDDGEKEQLILKMKELSIEWGLAFLNRDAENLKSAQTVILIGTKIAPLGLPNCGLCGLKNCETKSKYPDVPCAFNTGDLGIAIGSAVSKAMDCRVDNRIMWSAGQAAKEAGLVSKDLKIVYAIPLSVSGKNPFFDRK